MLDGTEQRGSSLAVVVFRSANTRATEDADSLFSMTVRKSNPLIGCMGHVPGPSMHAFVPSTSCKETANEIPVDNNWTQES